MAATDPERKEVAHDEAPANVNDHAFVPRGEWWDLCKICGLAQPAHATTTLTGREHLAYYSDDNPDDE